MVAGNAAMDEIPFVSLMTLANVFAVARCLHAVADAGVADALEDAPAPATTLATATGTHPEALDRVLRLLSAYGIFGHSADGYRHTPMSRLLRSNDPQSLRSFVRMCGSPAAWTTFAELEHSVRTGAPAVTKALSQTLWQYLSLHQDQARIFDEAMAAQAKAHVNAVIDSYDFSIFDVIGDIGGGQGHLLRAALTQASHTRGVLFDLPHVIGSASAIASDRITLQAGDFFSDPLPRCDAYLFMGVIHDWGDEDAATILRRTRAAGPQHARVLIIENVITDDPGPSFAKLLDILMLMLGGKQRTPREYAVLLDAAGFRFTREIQTCTATGVSIIEGVPV